MSANEALFAKQLHDVRRDVTHQGFAVVPNVVNDLSIDAVLSDLQWLVADNAVRQRGDRPFGIRNFVHLVPSARRLAASEAVMSIARALVGEGAALVRSLFFDKIAEANWKVAWHQDSTIAVKRRIETMGFASWSVKAAVPHVQPPCSVLEEIIALRIHLDDADESNGALRVIPSSHRLGRLSQLTIQKLTESQAVTCAVSRGSILVMRPLLLHSSATCTKPKHRRVVHLEFAGSGLPGGLEWNES